MKSFEEWVTQPVTPLSQLPELPEGVDEIRPGQYVFQCRSCEGWFPMEWDISEDRYEDHYCNVKKPGSASTCTTAPPSPIALSKKKA